MKLRNRLIEYLLGMLVDAMYYASMASRRAPRRIDSERRAKTVVLTGAFYSDNWLLTHVAPLIAADDIECVYMVATSIVPNYPGLIGVYPGKVSRTLLGRTFSRLFVFYRTVRKERPLYAGGFHLLLNGLVAFLAASAAGVKSMYFCGGGAREVLGGGYATENRLFRLLGGPSESVERKLIKVVNEIDLTLVMGSSAKQFFVEKGATGNIVVQPGGIDSEDFRPLTCEKPYDLVFVGRFSQVKRVDIFLNVLKQVRLDVPSARAVLVGEGPLFEPMKSLAESLDVHSYTEFVGWSEDVGSWLSRSKIFVMTSESEGLSQALIQAGLCGLPAIVTNVGDLSDLVVDGKNGFLIEDATVEAFSSKAVQLLCDHELFERMSRNAIRASSFYTIDAAAVKWDDILNCRNADHET